MTSSEKYTAITEVLQEYDFDQISHDQFYLLRDEVNMQFEEQDIECERIFKAEAKSHIDGIIEIGVEKYFDNL